MPISKHDPSATVSFTFPVIIYTIPTNDTIPSRHSRPQRAPPNFDPKRILKSITAGEAPNRLEGQTNEKYEDGSGSACKNVFEAENRNDVGQDFRSVEEEQVQSHSAPNEANDIIVTALQEVVHSEVELQAKNALVSDSELAEEAAGRLSHIHP